ncbi:death-associated protein 1 isoform X2 [Mustela putorius furo]|uniref:Death-associated protein 1 isoform X2 n=1 Tax=Mustela putorius furo TaxID=9669 RepID=A0A8U0S7W7_MUSPF|nr:death-associated protein 1 isoform X2 [Mustela putorius furo]
MSSPPEGKLETKAGHPPAVKAGGMRIVQKHPHSGDTKEEKDKDDQEWESPSEALSPQTGDTRLLEHLPSLRAQWPRLPTTVLKSP